jgi:hypothetical protein
MIDNTMAKWKKDKRTNINLQNTTQKPQITQQKLHKQRVNSGAPERWAVSALLVALVLIIRTRRIKLR